MIKPYFETKLGKLYNCDCLDFMKEMEDKSVDLVLTDPPYGINIAKTGRVGGEKCCPTTDYGKQEWDNNPMSEEEQGNCCRVSKNQIFFGGNYFNLPPSPCWLVWHKDNTGNFADCELAWTSFGSAVRYFRWRWNGMLQEPNHPKEKRYHPTQKPTQLFIWILKNYSKENELILDPFLGSGTTAIACEKLKRQWIGVEISEKYCEIAAKRISLEASQGKLW